MDVKIEQSWKERLSGEWSKPYFEALAARVRAEYAAGEVFPPAGRIFAALDATPFDDVKVVILGQDPYHDTGQANGLCFSVAPGVALPPSLINIFKEVSDDTGAPAPANGDLTRWARQGVLLLNSILTVRAHAAASHREIGWEQFTDAVIRALATERSGIVFMLWGSYAIKKGAFIDRTRHLVLESSHPSPLSAYRGFFGNHHFSRANAYLKSNNQTPIQW
ncbi:MAG: uracil-DNA glycosylase [Bacteroidales bacterium]|nr:uracil-DNA glycosylase [Bacteroidales bacterium]